MVLVDIDIFVHLCVHMCVYVVCVCVCVCVCMCVFSLGSTTRIGRQRTEGQEQKQKRQEKESERQEEEKEGSTITTRPSTGGWAVGIKFVTALERMVEMSRSELRCL